MAKTKPQATAAVHNNCDNLALIMANTYGDPEQVREMVAEIRQHCPELLVPPLSTALDAYEVAALAFQLALREVLD